MKNILKQLGVSATPSNQNNFKKAVLLLTTYYTLGVFVVLTIFNIMVYGLFVNSLQIKEHENKEVSLSENYLNEEEENRMQEIQDNLFNILLISDAIILLLTLIVAYISSKKTLAPLEESYKRQTRFVADAAHELRTPLAVMKAGAEVILRNNRTIDEYEKFVKECLEEVERLTTLSNDLLFLAHNNNKKINLTSKVSLSLICKKQIETMRIYASIKNITIEDFVDDRLEILGNREDLVRLVINLLKNAIDYNKKGGEVKVTLRKRNNKIALSIEDSGIGIKKEDLAQIFERFYKADNSRTQNSSSAGLGLSIVKEIADEHKGTIEVYSNVNKGTTFIVIFPSL
ncbi:MAG: HAMP domain-containing sensor histidine kinase [Candidatus Paceibacterota bacterium]